MKSLLLCLIALSLIGCIREGKTAPINNSRSEIQTSLASESCILSAYLAADGSKVSARLLDKPGEYLNFPLEGNLSCSEHFLNYLKQGPKFEEINGIKIPIEYQYVLKNSEIDNYLETVFANAKIGGFEVVLTEDGSTVKAIEKTSHSNK
ncbi:MAG: hypothetical protein ACOYL6_14305 [Bacteriovoracaceae bacterium]